MTFNCFGQSKCEDGAQCFQDIKICPTKSMCVRPPCYYGSANIHDPIYRCLIDEKSADDDDVERI
jgi:hypothetical protein